jgi:RimJ/RimL family protein N-acetyltransferase
MADAIALRPAIAEDIESLGALARDPAVEPYLAPGAWERASLTAWLERDPGNGAPPTGLYVIESPSGGPLGGLALTVVNRRNGICDLGRLMVAPAARRAGAALAAVRLAARSALVEHGLHRIEAQVYGDNPAGQRLFERAGFAREGSRRRAYWRRDQWLDGIFYGLLAEELADAPIGAGRARAHGQYGR